MVLYEHFNTTNQTSPHFERHDNFVTNIKLPSCAVVQTLPSEERCHYVTENYQCHENIYLINYIHILYCEIQPNNALLSALGIFMLLAVCGIIFIILGTAADRFFCPSLTVVSRIMGLNENVAGVTLLAFGNGASDMFTCLAGLQGESRRLYSDIFGAAVFVVFVVGGIIIAYMPFCVQPGNFLRDSLFLLLDVLFIDYVIKDKNAVTAFDSGCILFIYFLYIFVVIVDHVLVKRATKQLKKKMSKATLSVMDTIALNNLRTQGTIIQHAPSSFMDRRSLAISMMSRSGLRVDDGNHELFVQFLRSVNPYDGDEWSDSGTIMKIFLLLRMPIMSMLSLLIPMVDIEVQDHGWSKLLNCLQIVVVPSFVCYGSIGTAKLFDVPIFAWLFIFTVPLAIFVFAVTRTDRIPINHRYFALLGAMGSVFVVYACAAEIISVLDVLGMITNRSNSFIGCSLLAWGNSIGDLTANVALSRQGYQKMALAACFGGPLFNSLLAVGSTLFYKALTHPDFVITEVGEGTMGENCTIFLALGVLYIIVATVTTNFVMRRCIGIFMIVLYGLFMVYNVLGEFEIIHTYGSDHRMDLRSEPLDY